MKENRCEENEIFTTEQERELIDYVEERLYDEFTQSDFQNEMEMIENLIKTRCDELAEEMNYAIFKMRHELEEEFNLKAKRSFWKWWK